MSLEWRSTLLPFRGRFGLTVGLGTESQKKKFESETFAYLDPDISQNVTGNDVYPM